MKKPILFLVLIWALNFSAQEKTDFPAVNGLNLAGQKVNLPTANGKFSIIAIAYSRSAEDDFKKWLIPIYETFIQKDKASGGLGSADVYDVNVYFIPLISGFKRVADEFKNGTDKEYWPYIIDTEKTDIKEVQEKLGAKEKDTPYFYVVNKEGKVILTVSGKYQEAKLTKIEEAVE